jgi:hypothetical protein
MKLKTINELYFILKTPNKRTRQKIVIIKIKIDCASKLKNQRTFENSFLNAILFEI